MSAEDNFLHAETVRQAVHENVDDLLFCLRYTDQPQLVQHGVDPREKHLGVSAWGVLYVGELRLEEAFLGGGNGQYPTLQRIPSFSHRCA